MTKTDEKGVDKLVKTKDIEDTHSQQQVAFAAKSHETMDHHKLSSNKKQEEIGTWNTTLKTTGDSAQWQWYGLIGWHVWKSRTVQLATSHNKAMELRPGFRGMRGWDLPWLKVIRKLKITQK